MGKGSVRLDLRVGVAVVRYLVPLTHGTDISDSVSLGTKLTEWGLGCAGVTGGGYDPLVLLGGGRRRS